MTISQTGRTLATFPTHLQIQTTSACGAACSICPHPVESPNWSNRLITDELFQRILGQLQDRDIQYVCPYLMADPLSDKRIFTQVGDLRAILPEAHIEISTTGLYLNDRNTQRLLDTPLGELRISSHGITAEEWSQTMPGIDFEKGMSNILRFVEQWKKHRPYKLSVVSLWGLWSPERELQIEAFWREVGVDLSRWRVTSRSRLVDLRVFGNAQPDPIAHRAMTAAPPHRCRFHRDTEWMHILSDGRVTLCCMDYRQEIVLGDARTQSLQDIWNSPAYLDIRRKVRGDAPSGDDFLCKRCEWHVSESAAETWIDDHDLVLR